MFRISSLSFLFSLQRFRFASATTGDNKPKSLGYLISRCVANKDIDGALATLREHRSLSASAAAAAPSSPASAAATLPNSVLPSVLFLFSAHAPHRWSEALQLVAAEATGEHVYSDENLAAVVCRLQCAGRDLAGAVKTIRLFLHHGNNNEDNITSKKNNSLKRRMIAPLIELCASLCEDGDANMAAVSTGLHLLMLCRQSKTVQLRPVDISHFTTILQRASLKLPVAQQQLRQQHVVEEEVVKMLRELADYTPILEAEDFVHMESTLSRIGYKRKRPSTPAVATISSSDAVCSCCGVKLRAAPLTKADQDELRSAVESSLVAEAQTRKPQQANIIRASFAAFKQFWAEHGARFDVVVDGANLGFYGFSKSGGFDYDFVKLAVDALERKYRLRPLIVLHERHLEEKNFPAASAASVSKMVHEWLRRKMIFATSRGLNDDLCFVHSLTTPRHGNSNNNSNSSPSCFILTNDLLRDHTFLLRSSVAFQRLRERQAIGFKAKFIKEQSRTEFLPSFPLPYSVFLQRSANSWHVPVRRKVAATAVDEPAAANQEKQEQPADEKKKDEFTIEWYCFVRS